MEPWQAATLWPPPLWPPSSLTTCLPNGHTADARVGHDLWPLSAASGPSLLPTRQPENFPAEGAPRVTQEPFQCDKLLQESQDNSLSSFLPPCTIHKHGATLHDPPPPPPLALRLVQQTASPFSPSPFPLPCTPPRQACHTMGAEWLNCLWWSERQGTPLNPHRGMDSLSLSRFPCPLLLSQAQEGGWWLESGSCLQGQWWFSPLIIWSAGCSIDYWVNKIEIFACQRF